MEIPKISIITVGMNHGKYMRDLLPSVYSTNVTYSKEYEMIYVDNCSTDDSVEYISKHYPQVTIIRNKKALGFGENNNKGVLAAHGEYIAIINPDIILQEGCLERLYEYAESNPKAGVIVPRLLNPDGSLQYSVRRYVNLRSLMARGLTKGKDETDNDNVGQYLCKDIDYSKIQEIDWSIGAALFMKRELYATLGGFDTDYFLYMEDEDLCLRSWKIGSPVIYNPQSSMIHNHLRASSKIGKKMFIHIKSLLTFFKKHGLSPKR